MTCGICGRQVEVSDSGQAMPCACVREPLGSFLRGVVADCVGPDVCACGHTKRNHDIGWDAAGCMEGVCACRSYAGRP